MPRLALPLLAALVILIGAGLHAEPASSSGTPATVDFNRDIRPILSDNCLKCHGPDEKQLKAKLRLDLRDQAVAQRDGGSAIVPGQASKSLLIERLTTDDDQARMPPPKTGKRLTPQQIDLLKRWIDGGANYSQHWAFVKPVRPVVPTVPALTRSPIDNFIQARLAKEGLHPSLEAAKTTLIRRVTLDLTGLPPTPSEVNAFLADKSDSAYEDLVERLLASPRFGERMALEWLDAARYADTHGYHIDSGRDMTKWREWVIDAFNQNKPFDQFTVEQLAGDLLPEPTLSQKIASGFNRNHMINFEGGAIPEEYHTAYIVDRVSTTGTVWLGLTVACAQCHDHKYDPISQKDFYQLFAFFHNVPESGLDGSKGNAAPLLKVPTPAQKRKSEELALGMRQLEEQLNGPDALMDEAQVQWEQRIAARGNIFWTTVDLTNPTAKGGADFKKLDDGSYLLSGPNPASDEYIMPIATTLKRITGVGVQVLPDDSLNGRGPGRSVNGNIVLTDVRVARDHPGEVGGSKAPRPNMASATFSQHGFPVALAIDKDPKTGWAIHPEVGKPQSASFALEEPLVADGDAGVKLTIYLSFQSQFGQHQPGRIRISVTETPEPIREDSVPIEFMAILKSPREQRPVEQQRELRIYYRTQLSKDGKELQGQLDKLKKEQAELDRQTPSTMIMQEMPKPRDTFLLIRGEYDKKGAKVSAGVPAFLQPLRLAASGSAPNRLDLARWLVDSDNPLTARVTVNRLWQQFFGTGLVKTSEDFGSQGDWPSHPELLDWLATEFVQSGWDVKHMVRLMVNSATYRQASMVTPELVAGDPENRLLARASRLRLSAEGIRDQALAVSGLLYGEIGGKSVSPYQPPGLWEELMSRADGKNWSAQTYTQDQGRDLYRRTLYTFWKRTCPPPTLATFDAPDRETCTVRRARTNTPLQALILMNDPTYVEASRKLAERLLTEAPTTDARIRLAFRLATCRPPSEKELTILQRVYAVQHARFTNDPAAARKLLTTGESPPSQLLNATDLAAWTMVASVMLNLDEVVTRG